MLAHQGGFKIVVEKSICLTYNVLNKVAGKIDEAYPLRRKTLYYEITVSSYQGAGRLFFALIIAD